MIVSDLSKAEALRDRRISFEIPSNYKLIVMLNIERILNSERLLRATTGLNRKAFDNLLADFTKVYDEEDIIGGIPEEIPVLADLGFLGVQKQYDNIHLPHKKPCMRGTN